jgi:hypothetical protein
LFIIGRFEEPRDGEVVCANATIAAHLQHCLQTADQRPPFTRALLLMVDTFSGSLS